MMFESLQFLQPVAGVIGQGFESVQRVPYRLMRTESTALAVIGTCTLLVGSGLAARWAVRTYQQRQALAALNAKPGNEGVIDGLKRLNGTNTALGRALAERLGAEGANLGALVDDVLRNPDALKSLLSLLTESQIAGLCQGKPEITAEQAKVFVEQLGRTPHTELIQSAKHTLKQVPQQIASWIKHLVTLAALSYSLDTTAPQQNPNSPWEAWSRLTFYRDVVLLPVTWYASTELWVTSTRVRLLSTAVFSAAVVGLSYLHHNRKFDQAPNDLMMGWSDIFLPDMVTEARAGKYEDIRDRADLILELERCCAERLNGTLDRSPILVGEPGVGKTALLRGLALRIASGTCREELRDVKIFAINGEQLVGAGYSDPIGRLTQTLANHKGKVLVFIDEIHTLAKETQRQSAMLDRLKTEMVDGLNIIGATTNAEYAEHIATRNDRAWNDRVKCIAVTAPSNEEIIQILEAQMRRQAPAVKIGSGVLSAFVTQCREHYGDRGQPRLAVQTLKHALNTLSEERRFHESEGLKRANLEVLSKQSKLRTATHAEAKLTAATNLISAQANERALREAEEKVHAEKYREVQALTASEKALDALTIDACSKQRLPQARLCLALSDRARDLSVQHKAELTADRLLKALAEVASRPEE